MSPWVDDPETGTSHYERPKRRSNREHLDQAMALRDLATAHNAEQADGSKLGPVVTPSMEEVRATQIAAANTETFGAKMARLKAEKKQAQADAEAVVRRLESLEVQGS